MTQEATTDPLMGKVLLGRYRIVRTLARGGMGVVYLGRVEGAAGFAKPVVVKTVIPQLSGDSHLEKMFVREAQIVSNLVHPNIVGVIDFGEVDGAYMMVLEYVHGFHLGQWAKYVASARGAMPVAHAVHIVGEVLEALQYAHTLARSDGTPLLIVHRDVSPPNVLLDVQGRVRLHDFGVARMANEVGEYKTQDGAFRGTLSYSAPETIQGSPASVRSDIYSCGVVLYQLLSGSNPIRGQDPNETLYRALHHVPPTVKSLRPDVPEAISVAIDRAIAKDPADRFESASELNEALRAGADWDDEKTLTDFAATIERDFTGEMAAQLGLVPLDVRDAAWRDSLRSSTIPPTSLDSSPPRIRYSDSPVAAGPNDITLTAPKQVARHVPEWKLSGPDEPTRAAPAAAPPPQRKTGTFIVLGAVVALGAVAGLVLLLRRSPESADSKFVVIDRQTLASQEPSAAPAASIAPASTSTETFKPIEPKPSEPPAAPRTSDSQRLSRTFQKQQGKIEACVRSHETDLAGSPQISIRFQIDGTGKVTSAQVLPASVAALPLGACIAGVARATDFGQQAGPVGFSIPITARKVTN